VIDSLRYVSEQHRWDSFLVAHTEFPKARWEEVQQMLKYIDPQQGERIIEFGTGSGYLTQPLALAIKPGEVITYDVVLGNLKSIYSVTEEQQLMVTPKLFPFPGQYRYRFEEEGESIDKVVSLATFHHCDVHKTSYHSFGTGVQGRSSIFQEAARVLVPQGKLIIGDVADNTTAQRYFDAIQSPRYCAPFGHPHSFLSEVIAAELCRQSGFTLSKYHVQPTPWNFRSRADAILFLQRLHNAQCSLEELGAIVQQHLPFKETATGVEVAWELCFLVAEKVA